MTSDPFEGIPAETLAWLIRNRKDLPKYLSDAGCNRSTAYTLVLWLDRHAKSKILAGALTDVSKQTLIAAVDTPLGEGADSADKKQMDALKVVISGLGESLGQVLSTVKRNKGAFCAALATFNASDRRMHAKEALYKAFGAYLSSRMRNGGRERQLEKIQQQFDGTGTNLKASEMHDSDIDKQHKGKSLGLSIAKASVTPYNEIEKQVVGKKNGLSNAMIADTSLRGVLDVVAKQNGQASHAASCVNTTGDQSMEQLGLCIQTRFISFQGRYVDEGTGEHRSMCMSFKGDVEGKALAVRAAKRWYELVATCQSEAVDYMSQYRGRVTDARFREVVESAQAEYAEDSAMFDDIADEVISLGGKHGSQWKVSKESQRELAEEHGVYIGEGTSNDSGAKKWRSYVDEVTGKEREWAAVEKRAIARKNESL